MNNYNLEFKQIRENQKLTQSEFSKKLGISISIIAKIESGTIDISKKIAKKVVELYPELSIELKKYVDDNSSISKNKIHNERTLLISEGGWLSKIINSYTENYPVIDYYFKKIEDLKVFFTLLKDEQLVENIDKLLNTVRNSKIGDTYKGILIMYSEIEIIKQEFKDGYTKNTNDIILNKEDFLESFLVTITSQRELLKTAYEELYDLFKIGVELHFKINKDEIEILQIENEILKRKKEELEKEILKLKK